MVAGLVNSRRTGALVKVPVADQVRVGIVGGAARVHQDLALRACGVPDADLRELAERKETIVKAIEAQGKLTDELAATASILVTMGCGDECPLVRAQRRFDWKIPDPKEKPPEQFRKVRDLIEANVKELLQML